MKMKVNKHQYCDTRKIFFRIFSLIFIFLLVSCDRNRNHPGWDYFPDMFYSEAYESYTPNSNFEDGKTMREPVEGAIPVDYTPFLYTIDEKDRVRAGKELLNPFEDDRKAIVRGEQVFNALCANCHGAKGDGKGHLFTSGKYLVFPRSLVGKTAKDLKDGEIYHSIVLGYGSMGSHASQLRAEDRWKVITYIREVLQKDEDQDEKTIEKNKS